MPESDICDAVVGNVSYSYIWQCFPPESVRHQTSLMSNGIQYLIHRGKWMCRMVENRHLGDTPAVTPLSMTLDILRQGQIITYCNGKYSLHS